MGRVLLFALAVLCIQAFETASAEAAGIVFTSKDGLWQYEYVEESSGETVLTVDEYNGSDRDLVIPEEIDGYTVRYVGAKGGWNYGPFDMERFDSITIPDSVTGLRNAPFFTHSHNLKFLSLGKNFGTYSEKGGDINMIRGSEGYDIQAKEYRVSPENEVITAVDGVLYSKDMTELKLYPVLKEDIEFKVPDGVTSIDFYAMNYLKYLERLVLPDGLKEIGVYCCKGSSIRFVRFPDSLTSVSAGMFCESKLEEVILPETIKKIDGYAFKGTQLKEIVIPDTIVSLGAAEFMECDKLKSVRIGSGLAKIGGNCFYGLTSLETFEISNENPNFRTEGGMLLTKDGTTLLQYITAKDTELILPEGVTKIGVNACYGMPFREITIPDTVESIGNNAFENCTEIEKAYVPPSVITFGHGVFNGCTSLKTIVIDAQTDEIFSDFNGCDVLTDITLSETIKYLGDRIFFGKSLRFVHLKSPQAPSISYTHSMQGNDAKMEMIKKSSKVRVFVPEGAQGYDVLPWSRMHIVHGDTVAAERLTLNPSSAFLNVGETVSVQPVVLPEDAAVQNPVWETSDQDIVSVDSDGTVRALSAGTARIKATTGGLSTECIVTVKGNQPLQDFRVKASKGTASSNCNAQDYTMWSDPVKSYLYEDEAGCLTRVEFMDGNLIHETYGMDGTWKEGGSIEDELPLAGGYYVSGGYSFVVYGQKNLEESDNVEVMRIVKYDQDWNRVSSCSLYGENTITPFDSGCLRFAEQGDTLYIRTSHLMYSGHQANQQVAVDMSAMEIIDTFSNVSRIDRGGYVSHSFNQFLQMDGEELITLDHGDSHPRAAVLIKYPGIKDTTFAGASVEYCHALEFPGLSGNNATGASLGGLEVSEHYYIFAGNYVCESDSSVRNIFVNITDKDFLKNPDSRMVYLTDFHADSSVTVSTPQLVKVNEKTFLVLWNETDASGTTIHSQMIDEDGHKVAAEQSFQGSLSDCRPIVQNGQAVWYYTGTKKQAATPVFCRISVDGRETVDNLLEKEPESKPEVKDLSKCVVTIDKVSYVYDGKAKKPTVTVKDGVAVLKEGEDYTVTYSNNINVGTAKVTVTGKGNYTGTVAKNFNITVKKGTSHKVGSYQYQVTGRSTVSVKGAKSNKITKIKVPQTVKIGGKTFKVTAIASRAFKNNKKIISVEIADNVKVVGTSAFEGCTKLRRAILGKGITEIGGKAFKNCKKLGSITIRSLKLKKVGKSALKGIKAAAKIKVPTKKLSAYKKLFKNKGQGRKVKIVK